MNSCQRQWLDDALMVKGYATYTYRRIVDISRVSYTCKVLLDKKESEVDAHDTGG